MLLPGLLFLPRITQGQIVKWTFEGISLSGTTANSPSVATGTLAADVGTNAAGSVFSGFHTTSTTSWSTPTGNGSVKSLSSNNWSVGDYYQFQFSTVGYSSISLTWDARGTNTSPKDFKVQYSIDGINFSDATGVNSSYVLTNDTWTTSLAVSGSIRTLDLSYASVIDDNPAVYIRLVNTSVSSIGGGTVAGTGTSRIDNFSVIGTPTGIPSNTILLGTVSSYSFNITSCFAGVGGTVDFNSTGTFSPGNVYSVQLSDASGSFVSPVTIGTLPSTANTGVANFIIPANTISGSLYKIRLVSSIPAVNSNASGSITINVSVTCTSSPSDYFRSRTSGDWNVSSSWESSSDNVNWMAATLFPDNAANAITIQNGHSINIIADLSVDQLTIQTGSTLTHSSGILNVLDGSGDDISIQSGAVFKLASSANPPLFGSVNSSINVETGGILRIAAAGLTSAAPANCVNVSNYVYQHQSILEYTLSGGFATAGVTFFPNVNATTIPIFRITNTSSSNILVGAGSNTTFNGIFENNGAATVIWQNSGLKIFRNGIRGSGNIDGSGSGKFIINGLTAELGGTGSLTLPGLAGMDIGSSTQVTMISDKSVTGNIALLSNSYINLGIYSLTIGGTISGGNLTSHVVTNGTGILKIKNLGATDVVFPVGYDLVSYNPVTINNGTGSPLDFGVRVENTITPLIAYPDYGVNRTWNISSSATPGPGVTVTFQYNAGDVNSQFVPGEETDIYMNDGTTWSLKDPNPVEIGAGPFTVTSTGLNNFNAPFVIGKNGGYILPVDYFILGRSKKQNNDAIVSWQVGVTDDVDYFEVERSVNARHFVSVKRLRPVSNTLEYSYTDLSLPAGKILYRIKVSLLTGKIVYSNISAVINNSNGLLLTSVYPNPVSNKTSAVISSAKNEIIKFIIYDMGGRIAKEWDLLVQNGNTVIEINTSQLQRGTYQLKAISAHSSTMLSFIKQ
jgi:hypothetical protein